MAFPQIAASANSRTSANETSHTISLPTGITSGNLLLMMVVIDGLSVGWSWPSGWTQLALVETDLVDDITTGVAYRVADGSEGSTVTGSTSVAETSAHSVLRITGAISPASQEPTLSGAQGTANSPDPPNHTPGGGAQDYLWVAWYGADAANAVNSYPTDYTAGAYRASNAGSNNVSQAWAYRELNASSENPGAYSIASSEQYRAYTIAVWPAAAESALVGRSTTIDLANKLVTVEQGR